MPKKDEPDAKDPLNIQGIQNSREIGDLGRKLDALPGLIAAAIAQGDGHPQTGTSGESTAKAGEGMGQRITRETGSSIVSQSRRKAIRSLRLAEGYQDAAVAVTEEHTSVADMATMNTVDIGQLQNNMGDLARRIGRTSWPDRFLGALKYVAIVAALAIVGVEIFQPADLQIFQAALSDERNLAIFVGIVGVFAGLIFYAVWSRRRKEQVKAFQ
jgi:hypothetical protein